MPPSFYDTSSPPPPLFAATGVPHVSSQASGSRLPTLAVVLGLIGVLAVVSFVAGVCMYIFRGRLFAPAEPVRDDEDMRSRFMEGINRADQSSRFSVLTDDDMLLGDESEEPVLNHMPALRPLLLNPVKPVKCRYKELLLPRLQQIQSYRSVCHLSPMSTRRRSFSFGSGKHTSASLSGMGATSLVPMKVSRSCPAGLNQIMAGDDSDVALAYYGSDEDDYRSTLKNPKLVKRFSHSLPLISSVDSASSATSGESTLSSSGSFSWDYYINGAADDLFYKPKPLPSSSLLAPESFEMVCPMLLRPIADPLDLQEEEQLETEAQPTTGYPVEILTPKPSERLGLVAMRTLPLSKRPFPVIACHKRTSVLFVSSRRGQLHAVVRAAKLRKLRSRTAKFARLRSEKCKRTQTVDRVFTNELILKSRSKLHDKSPSRRRSSPKSKPQAVAKTHSLPTKAFLKKTPPLSSNRRPFGVVTNVHVLTLASAKQSPVRAKVKSPPRTRPSLQLNGVPADDLASVIPPRFNRHASPPRNPALLNTRWMPRPASPPLVITVFAKDRFTATSRYPGRRLTLMPPAGTSLAELRGSIERALGHYIGAVRGMVFVGKRTMFLPLLSERFYAQWVKERVREGGVGIVEVWRQTC